MTCAKPNRHPSTGRVLSRCFSPPRSGRAPRAVSGARRARCRPYVKQSRTWCRRDAAHIDARSANRGCPVTVEMTASPMHPLRTPDLMLRGSGGKFEDQKPQTMCCILCCLKQTTHTPNIGADTLDLDEHRSPRRGATRRIIHTCLCVCVDYSWSICLRGVLYIIFIHGYTCTCGRPLLTTPTTYANCI